MTVEEFLIWPGDPDRYYQLRDGIPVPRPLTTAAHGILKVNIGSAIHGALAGNLHWSVQMTCGLRSPSNERSFHLVDIAVGSRPADPNSQVVPDPILLVDVLLPETEDDDRRIKAPDYRMIPSVREIVLLNSEHMHCEVYRRVDDERWLGDILTGPEARLRLDSVGLVERLEVIYAQVPLVD